MLKTHRISCHFLDDILCDRGVTYADARIVSAVVDSVVRKVRRKGVPTLVLWSEISGALSSALVERVALPEDTLLEV